MCQHIVKDNCVSTLGAVSGANQQHKQYVVVGVEKQVKEVLCPCTLQHTPRPIVGGGPKEQPLPRKRA